jgi:hypothetical protein
MYSIGTDTFLLSMKKQRVMEETLSTANFTVSIFDKKIMAMVHVGDER